MRLQTGDGAEVREASLPDLLDGRPLVLVGMMGVGKSYLGRRLAARTGLPFADSDDEVERAAGMTVSEVFERFGEAHFRDREAAVVRRMLAGGTRVIALGGGAFVHPATRGAVTTEAVAVWIRAPVRMLCSRLGRGTRRPLLRGTDVEAVVTRLSAEREPAYAQAHLHLDVGGGVDHATALESLVTRWLVAGAPV